MTAPNSIILDTSNIVSRIRELTEHVRLLEGRYFITDLLEDVMYCLRDAKKFPTELNDLVYEIASGRYQYGYLLLEDSLAPLIQELGEAIFYQLKTWNVYLPDGTLPYHYCAVENPGFNDVLLIKLKEITCDVL